MKKLLLPTLILFGIHVTSFSQSNDGVNVFTGGLFMSEGRVEVKMYNNLYTQLESHLSVDDRRSSFNTSFLQFTMGTRWNLNFGFDLLYKSNVINDLSENSPFTVFAFMNGAMSNRSMGNEFNTQKAHGLTHYGPRLRVKPFKNKKFTLQQAVYAPTGNLNEGWIINTDLFFEHVIANRYMLFGDLGVWYPLAGDPFPYVRVFAGTLLAKRFGPFVMINLPYELGLGTKIFITRKLELEFMYSKWMPIERFVGTNKPSTINFGIRLTNFNNF